MKEAGRRSGCIHRRDDHIYAISTSQHVRRPQKNNESCDWKLQYEGCVKPGHVLLGREGYEGMEEPWDNIAKETWNMEFVNVFKVCAATLRSARSSPTGGDMKLQEFSGSLNLWWLNQNASAHIAYVWPWLLPSKTIVGHELERIPDTSSMGWAFMTQIYAWWRRVNLAGIRQEPSIPKCNHGTRKRPPPERRMGKVGEIQSF